MGSNIKKLGLMGMNLKKLGFMGLTNGCNGLEPEKLELN